MEWLRTGSLVSVFNDHLYQYAGLTLPLPPSHLYTPAEVSGNESAPSSSRGRGSSQVLAASSYNAKIAALESALSWISEHIDVIDKDDIHLLIDNKSVIQSFLQMQDLRRLLMAGNGSHKIPSDRRKVRRCQRHLEVRHPTWAAPGSSIP